MSEPRKTTRVRTMLGGTIVFNNRSSTIQCQIRNMSAEGAKIIVDDCITFPQRFDFEVPQKGRTYKAKVIWRQDNETGLEFIQDEVAAAQVSGAVGMSARMSELEKENALLRKQVIDLRSQLDRYMDSGA